MNYNDIVKIQQSVARAKDLVEKIMTESSEPTLQTVESQLAAVFDSLEGHKNDIARDAIESGGSIWESAVIDWEQAAEDAQVLADEKRQELKEDGDPRGSKS